MAKLDPAKPKIEAGLNQMPHKDVTVDGVSVALYAKAGRRQCIKATQCDCSCHPDWHGDHYVPDRDGQYYDQVNTYALRHCVVGYRTARDEPCCNNVTCLEYQQRDPDMFAGIMHDATPVALGIQGPAEGKWDSAVMKFSDWAEGAGTFDEESCVTMSAKELLQSHHANRTLWAFDQLMSQLRTTEPLSAALAFIPAKPSEIFASAAKLQSLNVGPVQLNEGTNVPVSPSAWVTMAMAAIGGVVGVASCSHCRRAAVPSPQATTRCWRKKKHLRGLAPARKYESHDLAFG